MTPQTYNGAFAEILRAHGLDGSGEIWRDHLAAVTAADVERALASQPGSYNLSRLAAFLSPAAAAYLEPMASQAHSLTLCRFGRNIQLYAPLYISNFCVNRCLYCGFNVSHRFLRTRLTIDEALADADVIASEGFRHILLVSGEDPTAVTVEYLAELAQRLRSKFSSISIEVQPLSQDGYQTLCDAGVDGLTLYQETFDRQAYARFHPAGAKADYDYRLQTQDRAASVGMRRLGLGVLLGLSDWRVQTLALGEHAAYLMKRYWRTQVSFSFPRIRPANEVQQQLFAHVPTDAEMVQMILALRLCFADAGITVSTRERADFRDNLIRLGVTHMSAGSRTNPGGYTGHTENTGQFEIDDSRSAAQVAAMIRSNGFEAVWKDWDSAFVDPSAETAGPREPRA